ncbi:MAG: hypothetical protein AABY22_05310, partial [Nanoarchaeota archaeon]
MALKSYNSVSIQLKVVNTLKQKQYQNFMYNASNARFVAAKQQMLNSFDNHIVTKELQAGPRANDSELVDHGNLASFIGFENSENSVLELREYLRENTNLENNPRINLSKNRITYDFPVTLPSKTEIYNTFPTPDNWSSRGWVQLIEQGIGNAANYVFRLLGLPGSRSGTGLQIKKKRKAGGSFKPI